MNLLHDLALETSVETSGDSNYDIVHWKTFPLPDHPPQESPKYGFGRSIRNILADPSYRTLLRVNLKKKERV